MMISVMKQEDIARSTLAAVLVFTSSWIIAAVTAAVLLYEAHVKQSLLNKKVNKKLVRTASRCVLLLRVGAFLTILERFTFTWLRPLAIRFD